MNIIRNMWLATSAFLLLAPSVVWSQNDGDDEPERTLIDPAQALPSRSTGEAVMGTREAFDREAPQIQVGLRRDRDKAATAAVAGAQLAGNEQTLAHDCDIGERVELVGDNNIVAITGQCIGLSVTGVGNQVTIDVVDEIRIDGNGNDIRWKRGFTVDRPTSLETGGRNSVAQLRNEG